jgi:alpha-acetolactate decarboxylase
MKQKNQVVVLILIGIIIGSTTIYGTSFSYGKSPTSPYNEIFQVSTFNSFYNGNFEGKYPIGNLKMHGDTGIGSISGVDGEMMMLNGVVYQAKPDGHIYVVENSKKTPFAMVTYFKTNKVVTVNKEMNSTEFEHYLNSKLPSKNMFYSFKIIGTFDNVTARSVEKQVKPYTTLSEVYKNHQTVFNFSDINGTMVGFWCPAYASGVNKNEYHFHFLSADKQDGGHVLDFKVKKVIVEIDYIPNMYVLLPKNDSSLDGSLTLASSAI